MAGDSAGTDDDDDDAREKDLVRAWSGVRVQESYRTDKFAARAYCYEDTRPNRTEKWTLKRYDN